MGRHSSIIGPIPKPTPRVVTKPQRAAKAELYRRLIKAAVFSRDKGKCRVCGQVAHEMHELQFRSLGGKRSLQNSIAVCNFHGKNCHRLLQTHVVSARPVNETRGANGLIAFTRDGKTWRG